MARTWSTGRLLVLVLTVAACGSGARASGSPSAADVPTIPPTPTATTALPPTPTPTAPSPTPTPSAAPTSGEPEPFEPPPPVCPGPAVGAQLPDILASLRGASVITTQGSATVMTCDTTGTFDAVPPDPTDPLSAAPGDVMTLALPSGWRFLRWEGSNHPVVGDAADIYLPVDTPDRPNRIEVPVPARAGRSIANLDVWIVSDDERVVAQLAVAVLVDVV